MKIVFVLDPLEKLKPKWDTSTALMRAYQARGDAVFVCEPKDLFWHRREVKAHLRKVCFDSIHNKFLILSTQPAFPLSKVDLVWMRKDPPITPLYLGTCQLLSLVATRVRVLNNPCSLLLKNEKLLPLEFPSFSVPSLVSASTKEILKFTRSLKGIGVIKPLNDRGGRGVQLLNVRQPGWRKKVERLTSQGQRPILVQAFLKEAYSQGTKRILLLNGKPLGAFWRHSSPFILTGKPLRGEKESLTQLTPQDKKICEILAPELYKLGFFFVGIDLIAGKLIEINFTSPGGIPELNKLTKKNVEHEVINETIRTLSLNLLKKAKMPGASAEGRIRPISGGDWPFSADS